jgi:tetratricopeptide (TPR) repeat protein
LGNLTLQKQRKSELGKIAIKLAEQLGNNHLLSVFWNDLGSTYYRFALYKDAFDAWTVAARFAEIVGNVRNLVGLEVNKALVLMQETEFQEAKENLEHAILLARRSGFQTVEKTAIYNHALCFYGLGLAAEARREFEQVRQHPDEIKARIWECRITLELGDGFVIDVPEIQPQEFGHGHYLLTQALLALSFGDYEKAWELTTHANHDSDWHWALARVHAGWRLGLRDETAIAKVLSGDSDDPAMSANLIQAYIAFIELVLAELTSETQDSLRALTPRYVASPIGIFARDVALSLVED